MNRGATSFRSRRLRGGVKAYLPRRVIVGGAGGQYVSLGQPGALTGLLDNAHEWSITFWFKRAAAGSAGALFSKANTALAGLNFNTLGGAGFYLAVGGTNAVSNYGTIGNTLWHHFALVCRNDAGTFRARIYINGTNISTEGAVGATNNTVSDILIMARRGTTNVDNASNIAGQMSNLTIYNRPLSAAEVLTAMAKPGAYLSGAVAHYRLDDGASPVKSRIGVYDGTITGAMAWATTGYARPSICGWGDSMTVGSGGTHTYLTNATLRQDRSYVMRGVSGESPTQIRVRMQAAPELYQHTTVIWAGRNGVLVDPALMRTEIATMWNLIPHQRKLVVGVVCKRDGTEDTTAGVPSAAKANINQLNTWLLADYGTGHFVSAHGILIAGANGTTDNADVALDRSPASLMSGDNMHPLDGGYDRIAGGTDGIHEKLTALGY